MGFRGAASLWSRFGRPPFAVQGAGAGKLRWMRLRSAVQRWRDHVLAEQIGQAVFWAPVFFALGVGGYFALSQEPPFEAGLALGALGLGLLLSLRLWRLDLAVGVFALACLALGFGTAVLRAHWVGGPVLEYRSYGAVEGRVVGLDLSGSGALRVTLDNVTMAGRAPEDTPRKIRISLHDREALAPPPGGHVMVTAHLNPPGGPTEPHGFDFQRHTWFLGLGAVGYTRAPMLLVDPPPARAGLFGLRMALSSHVQEAVDGRAAGFAAAITTGDRSALDPEVTQALRDTNLAHLLAISGLHMGLLTGFVFGALRLLFSVGPWAPHLHGRKLAAVGALIAGAAYLALSGGNVATERAFVMVAVAFGAVLLDRRAISMRSVALAALIVLILRPEALLSPGFQMSFAATIALVLAFRWLSDQRRHGASGRISAALAGRLGRSPVTAVFLSATVAGLATLPFAAAHFNRMASYGLIANLVAPPVMGVVVMPSAAIAAFLAPIGLDWVPLRVMQWGLDWIIFVANTVSSWPNSVRHIPAPPSEVLPLLSFGVLWIVLWVGRGRWFGAVLTGAALTLWAMTPRPEILVAENGGLVGVMTAEGRALSKAKGAGFVAGSWLENDGADMTQIEAAALWKDEISAARLRAWPLDQGTLYHASGKRALAALGGCAEGDVVVASVALAETVDDKALWPCTIYDLHVLRHTGAIALSSEAARAPIWSAREVSGQRLWNDARARVRRGQIGIWLSAQR